MGFFEVLTIVFITLKLMGVIAWNWWFVLLPEIIAITLYIVIFIATIINEKRKLNTIYKKYTRSNNDRT